MKIYTKFGKQETIEKFIQLLYCEIMGSGTQVHSTTTYTDEDCTKIQCYAKKFRSMDDLVNLIQTYYPEATVKDIMHELLTADIKYAGKQYYMHIGYCTTIGRIRIFYYNSRHDCNWNSINVIPKLSSKWSWAELMKMLELKNFKDIENYYNKVKNEKLQNIKLHENIESTTSV